MSSSLFSIIAVLLIAGAVAAFLGVRHQRLKSDLELLSEDDQRRHADILTTEKAVKVEQKSYDSAVGAALKSMTDARTPAVLAQCGPATLSETNIILNGRARKLTAGIKVDVDASGDVQKYVTSRTSATRVAAGAVLFGGVGAIVGGGAKKGKVHTQDTRQLFLIVTGPDWQEVVQADPNLSIQARQFAASVYSASPHAAHLLQQFQMRVAETTRLHLMAVADTGGLDAAKLARALLELDPLSELRSARIAAKRQANARPKQISPAK